MKPSPRVPFVPYSEMATLSVNLHSLPRPGGGAALLTAIRFELNNAESMAVIGPNGSGKTSLLRAIDQTLRANGDIRLNGVRVSSLSALARAKQIAVMAQNDSPDPRLTLEDYVGLGRFPFAREMTDADHNAIIGQSINETGLAHLRHRTLGSLSGGERQRASLARALAQTPRLLLLDEPTNHLDHPGREAILSLVKSKGIAVITVLHDLYFVDAFADRILLLHQGQQIACDEPRNVLNSEILRPVFGLNTFSVAHPENNGKQLRIFEVSHQKG